MTSQVPIGSSFPMAHCGRCARAVLTYVTIGGGGAEERLCVHCDGPIGADLKWVAAEDLEASGYYFGSPPVKKACGSGCGSCAVKKD